MGLVLSGGINRAREAGNDIAQLRQNQTMEL
jgi:hypothetical protein